VEINNNVDICDDIRWLSKWLLFNTEWAHFMLYLWRKQNTFDEMMMMSTVY
jgi:hypothetical protein